MRIPRPNLTGIAVTVATLALVVICAAVVFGTVTAELQRREFSEITASMASSDAMAPIEVADVPIETTVTVHTVSRHFLGEPGEEVTVELSPGVWQVLGGGTDEDAVTLASQSQVRPVSTTWTGFIHVISVLPLDEVDDAMSSATAVMPVGPMTLSVDTDYAWTVDFLRSVCPGEYADG